jgi:hypothetical protein
MIGLSDFSGEKHETQIYDVRIGQLGRSVRRTSGLRTNSTSNQRTSG